MIKYLGGQAQESGTSSSMYLEIEPHRFYFVLLIYFSPSPHLEELLTLELFDKGKL